ncbi:MAG: D-amino peptidase [Fimbriimonadaceae bacterium]|jgi:D-amino peptidase|nr:D-amino peptidase [Fimbriimonadaceae bacterium]
MRVYISTDIEGITGLVSWAQCGKPSGEHYDFAFARRMYTHDVNAAIRGARSAGATEVVVKDSHHMCKNLLVDELEPGTELISGYGAGLNGMMEGIEGSFDAAMLVGYHAMAGTARGLLEHALAGGLHRFWINGQEAGEIAASAAVAGAYGVPLVFISSDQAGCDEAKSLIASVGTYATKVGLGKVMAHLKHPTVTGPGIESAAAKAMKSPPKPYVIDGPVTIRAEFHTTDLVDMAATLESVKRVDGYTVEFTRPTLLEAHSMAYTVFQLSIRGRFSGE